MCYYMTLLELMDDITSRCFSDDISKKPVDWEFHLYRLIEHGFHSYFKFHITGMKTEDMTALRRLSGIERLSKNATWIYQGKTILLAEWLGIYKDWTRGF